MLLCREYMALPHVCYWQWHLDYWCVHSFTCTCCWRCHNSLQAKKPTYLCRPPYSSLVLHDLLFSTLSQTYAQFPGKIMATLSVSGLI